LVLGKISSPAPLSIALLEISGPAPSTYVCTSNGLEKLEDEKEKKTSIERNDT